MTKLKRKKYTPEYKDQVLERAKAHGVAATARDLRIAESMIYAWRAKREQGGTPLDQQKAQQAELARLKRENDKLKRKPPNIPPRIMLRFVIGPCR